MNDRDPRSHASRRGSPARRRFAATIVATIAAALGVAATFLGPAGRAAAATSSLTPQLATSLAFPGATYEGRTDSPNDHAYVSVSRTGRRLSRFYGSARGGRCSDGVPYRTYLLFDTSAAVSARGVARFTSGWIPAQTLARHDRLVFGEERQQGRLQFRGDDVIGSLEDEFRGSGITCHAGVRRFVLSRDGTPGAPLRNRFAETGRYRGHDVEASVHATAAVLTDLQFTYLNHCSGGTELAGPFSVGVLPLTGGRSTYVSSSQFTVRGGYRISDHYRITAQLDRDAGAGRYVARFVLINHAVIDRPAGHFLSSCGGVTRLTAFGPSSP